MEVYLEPQNAVNAKKLKHKEKGKSMTVISTTMWIGSLKVMAARSLILYRLPHKQKSSTFMF